MLTDRIFGFLFVCLMLALLCSVVSAPSQQQKFEVDSGQSKLQFTLDSTFHTIQGAFQLKPGSIQFQPSGGLASGQIVVDAASACGDARSRDHRMLKDILEVDKYPEIIFMPIEMKGALAPSGASEFQLTGLLKLHGQDHPMTLNIQAEVQGNSLTADTSFTVPYILWGLKDPSTFFVRVKDRVNLKLHAVGQLSHVAPR